MKKTIIALAAAGFVAYLLGRKKSPGTTLPPVEHTHHLTQVFSKAKQHAIND